MIKPFDPQDEPTSATTLDDVRRRLRSLGYLEHSVERFLLQDAMRPERPVHTVLALALKVGVLGGVPLAAAATFLLAWANQLWAEASADVLVLFLHLLPPFVFALGAGFVVLGGVLALVLLISHARRIETASVVAATVAACLFLAVAAFQGRTFLQDLGGVKTVLVAGGALALAVVLVRVLHGGLLTLAIRLRDRPPERPVTRLVWQTVPVAVALTLLAVPALFGTRPEPVAPTSLPALPGARVVVIGVDGVRADEVDALVAEGSLPALSSRLDSRGVLAPYRRESIEPAAFWTTVVTGLEPAKHGLLAVDGYRPRGMRTTLTRIGWMRTYFSTVGVWTGLVAHRPVLAPSRRVPAVWDLASRGGVPVLVINWWGTFPAEPLPGLMVAHGAYQLLPGAPEGAVAPPEEVDRLAGQAGSIPAPPVTSLLAVAARDVEAVLSTRALLPDAFYRAVFMDGLEKSPRFSALYLPALDIASGLADLGSVTQAALVRWQLGAVDEVVAGLGDSVDTIVLILDPGRRFGAPEQVEGRVLIWRRGGECDGTGAIEPGQVAAGLIRALGLPQSRELPLPPDVCDWPTPSLEIDTFGGRNPPRRPASGEEYLENLRSLGYL